MSDFPNTCSYCTDGAVERVAIGQRGLRVIYMYACREHAGQLLRAAGAVKPERHDPEAEQRTEPLCKSCYEEITWVTTVKDGRQGKRMPVNRKPLTGVELRHSMVVVNPRTRHAVVLTKALIESGEAGRWVAAGAQVYLSHYVDCKSAAQHRRQAA